MEVDTLTDIKEQIHIIKTLKLKELKIQVDHVSKSRFSYLQGGVWVIDLSKSLLGRRLQLIT